MQEDKLLEKFLEDPMHITISDCDKLLCEYGYTLNKGTGSHRVYHKKGARAITIAAPHGTRYIKSTYIKLLIKILELEK
jgi:predicted RNA binding protein YcfA (HicA-like mRNA interferase family)